MPLDVPRDGQGSFEPQIVPKHSRRVEGFDEAIISLYAKGLTTGEIQEHLAEIYSTEVTKDLISRVTDQVVDELNTWQWRPLDRGRFPVILIDAIHVKIREGQVTNRPIAGQRPGDGDFTLSLPVMLAVSISSVISRALSYGTIYTLKLLRRGTDIDRPSPVHTLEVSDLTVVDAMRPFSEPVWTSPKHTADGSPTAQTWVLTLGPITRTRQPQALFANESLAQALRQITLFGRDGLPVISTDGRAVTGWTTNQHVLRAIAHQVSAAEPDVVAGSKAARWAEPVGQNDEHDRGTGLSGYSVVEHTLEQDSAAVGKRIGEIDWPPEHLPVTLLHNRQLVDPKPDMVLHPGDRLTLLVPDQAKQVTSRSDATTAER